MEISAMSQLMKFLCVLLLATNVFSGGDDRDSGPVESLDELVAFDPCTDNGDTDKVYTTLILSATSDFLEGEIISAGSSTQAIIASYDSENSSLIYFQTADTGYGSFTEGDAITGAISGVGNVKEVVVDTMSPCSDQIVSVDEEALNMTFEEPKIAIEEEAKTVVEETVNNVIDFVGDTYKKIYDTCDESIKSKNVIIANTCAIVITGMIML